MALPTLLGANIYAISGAYLRDSFRRVHDRLGGDDRLLEEANKSSAAYWEFQKINKSLQPKDVTVTNDNSAEALLAALEARQRGEIVQYVDAQITQEAEFADIPRSSLWSARTMSSAFSDST